MKSPTNTGRGVEEDQKIVYNCQVDLRSVIGFLIIPRKVREHLRGAILRRRAASQ